jgi:xylobiose transport system substrate-binding protein
LLKAGAFGTNFGSVSYNAGGAPALFASGNVGFHLQGSWEYGSQVASAPDFAKNDLGWTAFPAIPGGKGNPDDIVGNPTNYFSVLKKTRHADTAYKFLQTLSGSEFVDGLVKAGALPATKNAGEKLDQLPDPEFAKFEFGLIQQAPNFQLSWDQALKVSNQTPMYTNLQKLFAGQSTPEQFADAMAALK